MRSLRRSRFLPCSLLLGAFLLAGCGGEDSPTSPSAPPKAPLVASNLPAGWTHKENATLAEGVVADYVDMAPASYGFSANLVVLTSPASGFPPADAMQMEVTNARKTPGISNLVVDSSSATFVGGVPGYRGQFRFTKVQGGRSFQILSREWMVVAGGKDIQIILTRLEGDSAAASAFREIEASIRFADQPK